MSGVLSPVRPRVLATQFIPSVPPGLHGAYGFSPDHAAAAVGRKIENQIGAAPDAGEIDIHEFSRGLHLIVLAGVIEPTRADGNIALGRAPNIASAVAMQPI